MYLVTWNLERLAFLAAGPAPLAAMLNACKRGEEVGVELFVSSLETDSVQTDFSGLADARIEPPS